MGSKVMDELSCIAYSAYSLFPLQVVVLAGRAHPFLEQLNSLLQSMLSGFFLFRVSDPATVLFAVRVTQAFENGGRAALPHCFFELRGYFESSRRIVFPKLDRDCIARKFTGSLVYRFQDGQQIVGDCRI